MTYFQGRAFVYLLAAAEVFLYHTEHKESPVPSSPRDISATPTKHIVCHKDIGANRSDFWCLAGFG